MLTLFENESKFLCLNNGESVLTTNAEIKYFIETDSIKQISPSVLNRC